MRRLLILLFCCIPLFAAISGPSAQSIIDKSIEIHGGSLFDNVAIAFDFRDKHYISNRSSGKFHYERKFFDSSGLVNDIMDNDGIQRYINKQHAMVSPAKLAAYSNSINSVIYFALLPYGLNDPAVIKKYIGKKSINGNEYHKIQVTFVKEGGGKDFEDVFVYWINEREYTMDYLAYSYQTDGGGLRFRSAYNRRKVNGITFQDYINYKYDNLLMPVEKLDSLYLAGKLQELSRIELKNITVNLK